MANLHMRLGENLGEILLDIAQDNIKKGNPEKAITTYTESLFGFTKEYVLMLLKNEAVLITDNSGAEMNMVDTPELLEANKKHIYDWQHIVEKKLESLNNLRDIRHEYVKKFNNIVRNYSIDDFNIIEYMLRFFSREELADIGYHNIAAKLIGDDKFSNQRSSGKTSWNKMCERVEDGEYAKKWEYALYYVVKYNEIIRLIHKEYMEFSNIYKFLDDNNMIEHYPFIEWTMENVLDVLNDYTNTSKGYYHPMCNTNLYEIKERMYDELLTTEYGNEYFKYGILKKNILDGYDAGWLSPTGEYYADNGETREMIHMVIAEKIFRGNNDYGVQMRNDGVSILSADSPERWLEKHGFIKIHDNDIYGSFIGDKDWTEYPYCPTPIQIKLICTYADKHYNSKFYTEADVLGRHRHPEPYSSYKVRQMDDVMLHQIFGR